jgi:hypothetical protein
MLCHATGFFLAKAGQDTRPIQLYPGHKNIQHTVRYTELGPAGSQVFGRTSYFKAPGRRELGRGPACGLAS